MSAMPGGNGRPEPTSILATVDQGFYIPERLPQRPETSTGAKSKGL